MCVYINVLIYLYMYVLYIYMCVCVVYIINNNITIFSSKSLPAKEKVTIFSGVWTYIFFKPYLIFFTFTLKIFIFFKPNYITLDTNNDNGNKLV